MINSSMFRLHPIATDEALLQDYTSTCFGISNHMFFLDKTQPKQGLSSLICYHIDYTKDIVYRVDCITTIKGSPPTSVDKPITCKLATNSLLVFFASNGKADDPPSSLWSLSFTHTPNDKNVNATWARNALVGCQLPHQTNGHTLVQAGECCYLFGKRRHFSMYELYKLHIDTDELVIVKAEGDLPSGTDGSSLSYANGSLFLLTGCGFYKSNDRQLYEFNLSNNIWSVISWSGNCRCLQYPQSIANGNLLYFISTNQSLKLMLVNVFDTSNREWLPLMMLDEMCGKSDMYYMCEKVDEYFYLYRIPFDRNSITFSKVELLESDTPERLKLPKIAEKNQIHSKNSNNNSLNAINKFNAGNGRVKGPQLIFDDENHMERRMDEVIQRLKMLDDVWSDLKDTRDELSKKMDELKHLMGNQRIVKRNTEIAVMRSTTAALH